MQLRVLLATLWIWAVTASANNGETVVNAEGMTLHLQGIGVAQELKSDLYIGAIYYPSAFASINDVTPDTVSKRMSFKLLSNLMPTKALQRHWKERIALNNARNVWMAKGDSILRFSNAFKDNLKYGDKIDFDYSPGNGTRIYFNDQLIETIESRQFFPLLMSAWFGDIPPTKSFKAALLGQQAADERAMVLQQYKALNFSARTLASAAKPEPKIETEVAVVSKPATVASKPVTPPANGKKDSTVANNNKPATTTPATTTAPVVAVVTPPVTTKPEHENKPLEPVAEIKTAAATHEPAVAATAEVDEDLLIGAYKREALERIRGFLEYPPRAWRLGLTGSGSVRATVDRSGNMLSSEVITSTNQMILDQAMLKMLERSMPLPPPPKELSSNELSLEIPVDFVR